MCLNEILSGASNRASSLEPLADIVAGSTASVTVTYEEKNEEGENDQEVQEETEEVEEIIVKKTPGKDFMTS